MPLVDGGRPEEELTQLQVGFTLVVLHGFIHRVNILLGVVLLVLLC